MVVIGELIQHLKMYGKIDMTGNELITITIEDGDKRISTTYSVLEADRFNGTKGEYHLLVLDDLLKKFNDSKEKD